MIEHRLEPDMPYDGLVHDSRLLRPYVKHLLAVADDAFEQGMDDVASRIVDEIYNLLSPRGALGDKDTTIPHLREYPGSPARGCG